MLKYSRIVLSLALANPLTAAAASMEERLEALENRQTEMAKSLEERNEGPLGVKLGDRLSVSLLFEVLGYYECVKDTNGNSEDQSDIILKMAQVGFKAKLNDNLTGSLVLLEDSEEGFGVEEATLDYERDGWIARFGRQTIPFGEFRTSFIEDPLTLMLGETGDTALLLGYGNDMFQGSAFVFRGDSDGDHINDWGASLKVTPSEGIAVGTSILSDLTDADAGLSAVRNYQERVLGWSAFARIAFGQVEATGEILGAARKFDEADLDSDLDGEGDMPLAWNAELAWGAFENLILAGRVGGTRELKNYPELQYGAGATYTIWKGATISVEYLREEYNEDFCQLESRDLVGTKLAAEF